MPACTNATITITNPLTVPVLDTSGLPQAGLPVYAFNGITYTDSSKTTNAAGQAVFTLPIGDYRFRSDKNGTQFWSGTSNHCTMPDCTSATAATAVGWPHLVNRPEQWQC